MPKCPSPRFQHMASGLARMITGRADRRPNLPIGRDRDKLSVSFFDRPRLARVPSDPAVAYGLLL